MNLKPSSKDIFGLAVENYFFKKDRTPISVHHADFYDDEIPVDYLFRTYKDMPELEQLALDLCRGRVLDVGCCAGSHSLELKAKGHEILPIDISEKCIQTCRKRGLEEALQMDFFELNQQKFDTILLLMNGIGIAQTLKNLPVFFQKLKALMKPDSQVLLDSSDLIFLYEDEILEEDAYYGEMKFKTSYKKQVSDSFPWLYLDFALLKTEAQKEGFQCELIYEDEHYSFLAKLGLS
ncbi:methyltransferase domain-containing protein [Psychroflexus sp. YR1-1]|uniref:Methyltransferase domain-containing protein n=1 Tax=Psychroflexus aurantiacus TaxID=2709310 RepID=A0A6B3R1P3_9FLAO|nr:methyltransferase domain-containing protein [Psychroflexus aurantiacus]NEV94182.1 methyltransferase domain-containing protein [Psychroflexus aurantiacus]